MKTGLWNRRTGRRAERSMAPPAATLGIVHALFRVFMVWRCGSEQDADANVRAGKLHGTPRAHTSRGSMAATGAIELGSVGMPARGMPNTAMTLFVLNRYLLSATGPISITCRGVAACARRGLSNKRTIMGWRGITLLHSCATTRALPNTLFFHSAPGLRRYCAVDMTRMLVCR